jgi:hypothetical protein
MLVGYRIYRPYPAVSHLLMRFVNDCQALSIPGAEVGAVVSGRKWWGCACVVGYNLTQYRPCLRPHAF